MLHLIEGHPNGLQYKHILQNVMVPSVRMPYPDVTIQFPARPLLHSRFPCSSRMAVAVGRRRTLDWPPRAPDMNPIENMWSEAKRTMQETWPVLPPRTSDELWNLVSDAWDEVASSRRYFSITDTTNEISGRSTGVLDLFLKRPVSDNSHFKG